MSATPRKNTNDRAKRTTQMPLSYLAIAVAHLYYIILFYLFFHLCATRASVFDSFGPSNQMMEILILVALTVAGGGRRWQRWRWWCSVTWMVACEISFWSILCCGAAPFHLQLPTHSCFCSLFFSPFASVAIAFQRDVCVNSFGNAGGNDLIYE